MTCLVVSATIEAVTSRRNVHWGGGHETCHAGAFVEAGENIRYCPRPRLATVALPGSGDFYVFDDELVLFLHYAGNGTNASFEVTEDRTTVRTCRQAFDAVWTLAVPFRDYRPE